MACPCLVRPWFPERISVPGDPVLPILHLKPSPLWQLQRQHVILEQNNRKSTESLFVTVLVILIGKYALTPVHIELNTNARKHVHVVCDGSLYMYIGL